MTESIPANIAREATQHAESKELKVDEEHFYRIWQSGASPYSQKVIAYMNYKGIPYKKILSNMEEIEWLKKSVGRSIVPVMMSPNDEVMQDSTPIMMLLEARFPEVSTIPEDPRLAFLMWLIEEFCDEYLIRLIVHTRWGNEENREAGSHRIARTVTYANPHIDTQKLAPVIRQRQLGFDPHLGLSDDVRANMDQQLSDLLAILEIHFRHYQFLLGFRPTMADFAFYGFMLNMYEDPASRTVIETKGPRVCNWIETIRDLGDRRGCAGQTKFGALIDLDNDTYVALEQLLLFIGKTYIPLAKAAVRASEAQEKQFDANVYGFTKTFSNHQYRVWSFEQLQTKYLGLSKEEQQTIDQLLKKSSIQPAMMESGVYHCTLFDGFTPPIIKNGVADARMKHQKSKEHPT